MTFMSLVVVDAVGETQEFIMAAFIFHIFSFLFININCVSLKYAHSLQMTTIHFVFML